MAELAMLGVAELYSLRTACACITLKNVVSAGTAGELRTLEASIQRELDGLPSAGGGDAGCAGSGCPAAPAVSLPPGQAGPGEVSTVRLYGVLAPMRLLADLAEKPDIADMELAGRLRVRETAITAGLALKSRNKDRRYDHDGSQAPDGA
jgi:hypothetical protein